MQDSTRQNVGRFEFLSNEHGRFHCDNMPAISRDFDSYRVWITHPEFLRNEIIISDNAIFDKEQRITLKAGVVLSGVVFDDNGIPFAGAIVEWTDAGTWPGFQATSGPDGRFTLGAFEEGAQILPHFWAPGFGHAYKNVEVKQGMTPIEM